MECAEGSVRDSIESIADEDMEVAEERADIVDSRATSPEAVSRGEVEIKLEPESPAASPASLMFESGRDFKVNLCGINFMA
jgi:hypothetical protein